MKGMMDEKLCNRVVVEIKYCLYCIEFFKGKKRCQGKEKEGITNSNILLSHKLHHKFSYCVLWNQMII